MAFVRTAFIILALLIGWTALRHQSLANAGMSGSPAAPSSVGATLG